MRLFLVRHAEAAPGTPDELRALTPEGRRQASELGRRLARERPALVLTSPLLRARQTADAIARASGAGIRVDERLAPGATADDLRQAAARAGDVAVGHQPDCGRIAAELTDRPEPCFPPAGVAELTL